MGRQKDHEKGPGEIMESHGHHEKKGKMMDSHRHHEEDYRRRFIICLLMTIPVILLGELPTGNVLFSFEGSEFLVLILSSAIFLYGGYPFLRGSLRELSSRTPGMMTLIAVAITVAYTYSLGVILGLEGMVFFVELVTLIDVMLLGHWIEMRSIMSASGAVERLAGLLPRRAHLVVDGKVEDVDVSTLKPGDIVVVRSGERVPSDGTVIRGESHVNESLLTGESRPIKKVPGDGVIGGSINTGGSLTVEVERVGEESFISQIIELVGRAQEGRTRTQVLADKAAFWLTSIALLGGLLTFIAWSWLGMDVFFSLERAVTLMVTACPHALGLAIPLVIAVSTAISAGRGILIRNRESFENARDPDVVVFDKTGTLTMGELGITDVISFDPEMDEGEILSYAAAVESGSSHPIARGIVEAVAEVLPVENFNSLEGRGVMGHVNGSVVKVLSYGYTEELGFSISDPRVDELIGQAKTTVFVIVDDELRGCIALADMIRPEAREAVGILRSRGVRCLMLTGDSSAVAGWVASEVGIDDYMAELIPIEKYDEIRKLQEEGLRVVMVGDGVNDAPALVQADIGVAIGAGTDVAIESADVVLVRSNPLDVVDLMDLAAATYSKMKENLIWATGYNVIALPLAAGVLYGQGIILSPAMGAILMSLSTVIVALNARTFSFSGQSGR
ncbi:MULTISPECIES: heavy metal translocating P-type ATPase [Methanothermobacter]|jgi:Cu2+-exporting ATPase|uniref:Copper-translocating P-type ATPase n=1 Tax=Methanothermobacter thermautotrophicus TaxID=145262 RepID=A0A7J4MUJ4_METTF|nr:MULTISPECIES: heavy metal translocating P-type ATPase [Methanothermobacter]MBC7111810.1 copper-translocating P-type ATPase [Methanothermobacter sp.]MDK2875040.1 P-type Cu2+ transporter [Methanothermobacter sp.]MDN5373533.1 P-type Cu2+ transporter [Methanothermobacter sp.]WBF06982.1 copper-translocating P-type ATPase [Methanothermobacter thermautotrophicus]BAZ98795.1 Copper-exporting P-type ATPase B [Methanothermobacter sp. EMTCatA1]